MSSDQAVLALGVCDDRPQTTPLLTQRSWRIFEDKTAALRWARRNAPIIPREAVGLSAHPRVRQATLGSVLVYDCVWNGVAAKCVLTRLGTLERLR